MAMDDWAPRNSVVRAIVDRSAVRMGIRLGPAGLKAARALTSRAGMATAGPSNLAAMTTANRVPRVSAAMGADPVQTPVRTVRTGHMLSTPARMVIASAARKCAARTTETAMDVASIARIAMVRGAKVPVEHKHRAAARSRKADIIGIIMDQKCATVDRALPIGVRKLGSRRRAIGACNSAIVARSSLRWGRALMVLAQGRSRRDAGISVTIVAVPARRIGAMIFARRSVAHNLGRRPTRVRAAPTTECSARRRCSRAAMIAVLPRKVRVPAMARALPA